MKQDFDTMTLDELRDWVARDDGLPPNTLADVMLDGIGKYEEHPIPATLSAADAAMPEGWDWQRNDLYWFGFWPINPFGKPGVSVSDTGNKVRDLFCLACKCRWAKKEAQQ